MPWHKNIARSLKKAPKYYFFDNGLVRGDQGALFENLVACALIKEVHLKRDTKGRELELRYLRNRDGDELDFAVIEKGRLISVIEAKWADDSLAKGFTKLLARGELASGGIQAFQIVGEKTRQRDMPIGVKVRNVALFLTTLDL